MSASYPIREGVDPNELDEQVEGTYDGGFATEDPRPAPPHADPLAETPGYPPLCPHGMNSLTDRGYDQALARMRRGDRRTATANPHHIFERNQPCPHTYIAD
jgi:hypothetical protein